MWPGKAKPAPSFSAFLWIGLVQSAAGLAAADEGDAALDDRDDGGGVGRVGAPGGAGRGSGWWRTGRPRGERGGGPGGRVDRDDGDAEAAAERGHVVVVADEEEGRAVRRGSPRP